MSFKDFSQKYSKKALRGVVIATSLVTPFIGGSANAGFTWSLTNVMQSGDTTASDALNNTAFGWMVNFVYSMINYLVSFFFQSTVLSVVIGLTVIATIAWVSWHYIKKKAMGSVGGWKKRKR